MQRLYFLVERCHSAKEPVLLVGETGGGKTTVCQLLSSRLKSKLHILNCHQYTETSDFLGVSFVIFCNFVSCHLLLKSVFFGILFDELFLQGFYPVRERSTLMSEFEEKINEIKALVKLDPFNCSNPDSVCHHFISLYICFSNHIFCC